MIRKSISFTEPHNDWIQAQIAKGDYGSESELIRDLIRERQARQRESIEEIEAIRAKLVSAEQSGISAKSVDDIWAEARRDAKG